MTDTAISIQVKIKQSSEHNHANDASLWSDERRQLYGNAVHGIAGAAGATVVPSSCTMRVDLSDPSADDISDMMATLRDRSRASKDREHLAPQVDRIWENSHTVVRAADVRHQIKKGSGDPRPCCTAGICICSCSPDGLLRQRFWKQVHTSMRQSSQKCSEFKEALLNSYIVFELSFTEIGKYVDRLADDVDERAADEGDGQGTDMITTDWLHASLVYRKPWRMTPTRLRYLSRDDLLDEIWLEVTSGGSYRPCRLVDHLLESFPSCAVWKRVLQLIDTSQNKSCSFRA